MSTDQHTSDKDLLLRLRDGDEVAFSHFFLDYYPGMCSFAERYVGRDAAEDVVGDVFFKLLQSSIWFEDAGHLKAYLFRAIRHAALNVLKTQHRAKERQLAFSESHDVPGASYLAYIMQTEAMTILHRALETLPEQQAHIVRLTYLEGKTHQEVADQLQVSINTIKTQKQRALHKLRQILPRDQLLKVLILFFT